MKWRATIAGLLLIPVRVWSQVLSGGQALDIARKYLADLNQGKADAVWLEMTPEMQSALKDAASWKAKAAQIAAQLGAEGKVENERVVPGIHMQIYTRLSEFSMVGRCVTTLALNDQRQIAGFFVGPVPNPAESRHLEYKDKTKLSWPLQGLWLVYQGGRSVYDNYHAASGDQRFAYDIVGINEGKLYSGNGDKPEDFFGFGQPVFAPAAGTVVVAVDQYDDNPINKPSSTNPRQGNTIVIDHGNGEFSMMAHIKRGSVKVKVGDKIKTGQEIGRCGNSGNSPFPHLHYHLQTTPEWFKGDGLPVAFHAYLADGKPVEVGEPVRGQVIQEEPGTPKHGP